MPKLENWIKLKTNEREWKTFAPWNGIDDVELLIYQAHHVIKSIIYAITYQIVHFCLMNLAKQQQNR